MDITEEIEFCKSIDCEENEKGQMIYTSTNGASSMNLPYVLKEYLQWKAEREKKDIKTDKQHLPLGSVSQQRELLIALMNHCDNRDEKGYTLSEFVIDEFLESNL